MGLKPYPLLEIQGGVAKNFSGGFAPRTPTTDVVVIYPPWGKYLHGPDKDTKLLKNIPSPKTRPSQ